MNLIKKRHTHILLVLPTGVPIRQLWGLNARLVRPLIFLNVVTHLFCVAVCIETDCSFAMNYIHFISDKAMGENMPAQFAWFSIVQLQA